MAMIRISVQEEESWLPENHDTADAREARRVFTDAARGEFEWDGRIDWNCRGFSGVRIEAEPDAAIVAAAEAAFDRGMAAVREWAKQLENNQ